MISRHTNRKVLIATMSFFYLASAFIPAADTSLTVSSAPGYPGTSTPIPVLLRDSTNAVATQFDVTFNSSKVSADAAVNKAGAANHIVKSREIAPGVRRVIAYSLRNDTLSNSAIAVIPFHLAPTEHVSSGPLVPTRATLANNVGSRISPVTLNSGQIFARPVNRRDDGIVDFFMPARADEKYLIQATTNFVNWENISTNIAISDFMQLVDLDGPNYPFRFYRSALFDAVIGGTLSSISRDANGSAQFQITGLQARTYTIQASGDLKTWSDLQTRSASSGKIIFSDPDASLYPQRFYRLRSDSE
jgi:hypothetical protein